MGNSTGSTMYMFGAVIVIYIAGMLLYQGFQCKPKQNNYDQYYNYIYHYLSPLLNSSSFFCSLFFLSH